jgi:hypothetical protein
MGNHATRMIADQQRALREAITKARDDRIAGGFPDAPPTAVELSAALSRLGFRVTAAVDAGQAHHLALRSIAVALVRTWGGQGPQTDKYRTVLVDTMAELLGSGGDDGPAHGYLSTACLHALTDERPELHEACRVSCKYGAELCCCPVCNHQITDAAPDPLEGDPEAQ